MKPGSVQNTATNPKASIPVISFDMKNDDNVRSMAKKGHNVQRSLKEAGLTSKKVIPACKDPSMIKLFKLPENTDALCLEIDINNKTDVEKGLLIEDVKNSFLLLENFQLIAESPYSYSKGNNCYRFLFRYGK